MEHEASFLPSAAQFGSSSHSHMTFLINPSAFRKRLVSMTTGRVGGWVASPDSLTPFCCVVSLGRQCVGEVVCSKPGSGRPHAPPVRCQADGLCCPRSERGTDQAVRRPRERPRLCPVHRRQRWTLALCESISRRMSSGSRAGPGSEPCSVCLSLR